MSNHPLRSCPHAVWLASRQDDRMELCDRRLWFGVALIAVSVGWLAGDA